MLYKSKLDSSKLTMTAYAFDTYYTVDMAGVDIGSVEYDENQSNNDRLDAYKSYQYKQEILSLVARILITIAIEMGIALLFGFRGKKALLLLIIVNTVTQIILNVLLNTVVQQKFSYLTPKFGCAPKYTFNEHVNRERLRFLKEKDIPLVAYSCLCKGGYENVSRLPNDYELSGRYQAIKDMAKEKGLSVSAMVLSYLMSLSKLENYPQIIPLFSSSEKHVLENLRSTQLELDIEELQFLNSIIDDEQRLGFQ